VSGRRVRGAAHLRIVELTIVADVRELGLDRLAALGLELILDDGPGLGDESGPHAGE
jgi:hypothetical protein